MSALFKWIDQLILILPPGVLTAVRLCALGIWVVIAIYLSAIAWQEGKEAAPQEGQKQSLTKIETRLAREKNVRAAPDIILDDLGELAEEQLPQDIEEEGDRALHTSGQAYGAGKEEGPLLKRKVMQPVPFYIGESSDAPLPQTRPKTYLPEGKRLTRDSSLPFLPADGGLERGESNLGTPTDPKRDAAKFRPENRSETKKPTLRPGSQADIRGSLRGPLAKEEPDDALLPLPGEY